MQASTIRDFRLMLGTLEEEPIKIQQYLRENRPKRWSIRKAEIYLKVLKEFGFIELNNLLSITEQGKDIISLNIKKEYNIFIDVFFQLLNNSNPINKLLDELKQIFLLNPKISIKKLVKKTKRMRELGIVGQYFVSILLSSFFLYNQLPREEKYLELLTKSFINTFIDKNGISCQKLFQTASHYNVNAKKIKFELLKKWRKNYLINFPNEIKQILVKAFESKPLNSLPFLIDKENIDINLVKKSIEKYPSILQYVKFSKSTNKMKLKITEDIFLEKLIIKLR